MQYWLVQLKVHLAQAIVSTWFQVANVQVESITCLPFIWFWGTDKLVNPSVNLWWILVLLICCFPSVYNTCCGAVLSAQTSVILSGVRNPRGQLEVWNSSPESPITYHCKWVISARGLLNACTAWNWGFEHTQSCPATVEHPSTYHPDRSAQCTRSGCMGTLGNELLEWHPEPTQLKPAGSEGKCYHSSVID